MDKQAVYKAELEKLTEIFKDVDEFKRKLVEGLIEDACFLKSENYVLKEILVNTGMIKIHPQHPSMQKPVIAAKEYRQNLNAYAVIIKTLNGVLQKNIPDGDDDFDDFMKEMRGTKDE
jgi:regulator of replication initiation timing